VTTRAASEIVIGPVITERTYQLYTQGRYTFRVATKASKTDIKKALEEQYEAQGIKVKDVNTVSMRGKRRRSMRSGRRRSSRLALARRSKGCSGAYRSHATA
jgi:large subunit ribosomal protein L23